MTITHFTAFTAFLLSTVGLAFYRKHLVSALLCIEGTMLSLFVALTLHSQALITFAPIMQPLVLLTLAACGASAGLALLVASARTHASDHLKTLNLLKC